MKPFRVLVPIVVAGVVVLAAVFQLSSRSSAQALRQERESLRREMVERSAVARGLAGPQGVEEARAVVGWWFDEVKALQKRYPHTAKKEEAHAASAKPERATAGPASSAGRKESEVAVWQRYASERLEALRAGYAPVLSGADQGLRLDLLAMTPGENPDTHERALRIDFALWGVPRRLDPDSSGSSDRPALRVVVPVAFRGLAFRFIDAAGKTYGEMTGSGEPYLAVKDPERFSDDLPPGIVLGTWWVEPFPAEAARVEVSVSAQVQGMTSATLAPAFRWEAPVRAEWQLRPGESFHAETREAPPESALLPRK